MSVLDSVIKLRELDEQQGQQMVDSLTKGITLAQNAQQLGQANQELMMKAESLKQDYQKMSLLDQVERRKVKSDMLAKGIDFDVETNQAKAVSPELMTAIQQTGMKPETETDLYLKQLRVGDAEAKAKERGEKGAILDALNESMTLPDELDLAGKKQWLAEKNPIVAETVGGLIDYTIDPTKFASLRTDERTKYLALARKVDPNFNMMEYPKRQKYINSISDPSTFAGRNIVSLNTVAHHIAGLDEELEANKGANFKPTQSLLNWAREMTGDPSITDEQIAMKVVKDELEKALAGTVTQEALKDFDKIFNPNVGYEAKKNAVKTFVKIVKGRIQPYRESFKQVMKREESGEIINEESRMIFDKYLAPAKAKGTAKAEADGKVLTRELAQRILQQVGGDKEQARQRAKELGYSF